MENLSHSRHPNRSTSSLPKKPCNTNNGFSYSTSKTSNNTTSYDDVFGGPPRFGAPTLSPRLEDYCEIFAGFNGSSRTSVSSIPVLDLPLVDDRGVYFDVRSQGFDYREVFGGFNDLDLAPSYEELFIQKSTVGDGDSSDDAWTPEEVESCSGGTEHSEKSPSYSNGRDSYDSIDGSTEFNISYNKVSQISDINMSSGGVIRVADLGAIPAYTVAVDEMISAGGTTKVKETGPSSVSKTTSRYAFEDKDMAQKYDNRAMSFPSEPFVTVSEIGLKTHPTGIPPPSRPPPVMNSNFRDSASFSRTTGSEGSADSSSPPFFDVEVDASSAALREAMFKAEAKLKGAKELLERKRGGERTTRKRTSMKNGMTEEGKSSHAAGLPTIENNIDVAKNSLRDKSLSSHGSANSNDEWEEATQFVELARTEQPRNADESSGRKDVSFPLNADFANQKLTWAASLDWEKQQRRAKGDMEDREAKKFPKHPGTRKVTARHKRYEDWFAEKAPEEPNNEKPSHFERQFEIGNDFPDHGGIVKHRNLLRPEENKLLTEKLASKKKEVPFEEKTKHIQMKSAEKNQEHVFDWEQNARKLREALGLADNESTLEVSMEMKGSGTNLEMLGERDENEIKLNEALNRMEEETRIKEARVKEDDRREREALEKRETKKRLNAALEQEEKEKKLKEAREKAENERRVAEACQKAEQERKRKEQEEYELRIKEAFEKEEKNHRMREAHEKAEHERRMKVAAEQEKERKIKEALEKEENEQRIKKAREKAELEQRQRETLEQEEKERRIKEFKEREENERRAKEVLEQAENERKLKEALEQKEKERRVKEAREKEEKEKKLKEAIELEEKEKRLIEAFERAETERRLKEDLEQENMRMRLQEAKEREERERTQREYQEHQKNEMKQPQYTGEVSCEKQRDACEMEKTCETTKEAYGKQRLNKSLNDTQEKDERVDNNESVNKQKEVGEEERPSQSESMSEESCPWKVFEKNLKDASQKEGTSEEAPQLDESGESSEESASVTDIMKQNRKKIESSKHASILKRDVGMKTEVEERSEGDVVEDENVRKAGVGCNQRNQEESKGAPKTSSGFRNHEDKLTHQQERGSIYDTQVGLNQDAKSERPLPSRVFVQREKEAERLKREREFEMERLRKIEEEREREREREKDRMAFDQRALADARERLEKACAEAREKSLPDKSSIEARLRAERAAVERATTEARERAAEKAAFEARERMERSVSDKQFQSTGFFGERIERSVSDKHFQNSTSFGTDGESPQRYTSRIERHRRTADRVAKALAEKNMRDLVVQREQAERNRIAETLDAEVKRWSSGKEGNIRALLSTLQYILGTESGWQPLPLTEVITSAAVKRAYRKATLCVHPDKLQQRSANIHQKYISEKVFDLLKDAWNKFNSEER